MVHVARLGAKAGETEETEETGKPGRDGSLGVSGRVGVRKLWIGRRSGKQVEKRIIKKVLGRGSCPGEMQAQPSTSNECRQRKRPGCGRQDVVDAAASESKGRRVTVSRIGIGHSQLGGGLETGYGRCNGYTVRTTGWKSAKRGGEGMEADERAAGAVQVLSRLVRGRSRRCRRRRAQAQGPRDGRRRVDWTEGCRHRLEPHVRGMDGGPEW